MFELVVCLVVWSVGWPGSGVVVDVVIGCDGLIQVGAVFADGNRTVID